MFFRVVSRPYSQVQDIDYEKSGSSESGTDRPTCSDELGSEGYSLMWPTSGIVRLLGSALVIIVGWLDLSGSALAQLPEGPDPGSVRPEQVTFRILGLMKTKSGAT